jgi:RHS repeat-associated protein
MHLDGAYTEQSYDAVGNLITKTDENSNVTAFSYDALNRLKTVTYPAAGDTRYTYDSRNNLTSITDANENVTTYAYDNLNRLISITSPDTGTTTYTYDANGNMITKTDANGLTTTYLYDALNRLIAIQFPDPTQNIYYYYDDPRLQNSSGKLTAVTDSSGTVWYDYDKMRRIITQTKQVNNLDYRTEYSYDLNGNISTTSYPGGRKIMYTYDRNNKVSAVAETVSGATRQLADNVIYAPFGDIISITYGNGITTTKTYDNRYRLNGMIIGTLKQFSYAKDNSGGVAAIINNLNPAENKSYAYDSLYRLTLAAGPWGVITYEYDNAGNRTYETTDTGSTTYNYIANMLTGSSGEKTFNIGHDNNGNTVSDNTRQYIYNQNQRLARVIDADTVLSEYVYNGEGQRVKKIINGQTTIFLYDHQGLQIAESNNSGTITNEYVYLNGSPLAKIEGVVSGTGLNTPEPRFNASMSLDVKTSSLGTSWLKYYYTRIRLELISTSITGLTIAGNTAVIMGVGTVNKVTGTSREAFAGNFTATITNGSPDAMSIAIYKPDGTLYYNASSQAVNRGDFIVDGSKIYYYHNDHLGTPMMMTDGNGTKVWEGEFLPFGETLSIAGTVTNNLRFPGQYYDAETGMHYNWYRDYKPEIGRYIEADPIGLKWGENHLYNYAGNNPLNMTDANGLFGCREKYAGHDDFKGSDIFDYCAEDDDPATSPYQCPERHFRPLEDSERDVAAAINSCNKNDFERSMHRGQDFFSHYQAGYRWKPFRWWKNMGFGHGFDGTEPDHNEVAWKQAEQWTKGHLKEWIDRCSCK